jgi:hypothetical protein
VLGAFQLTLGVEPLAVLLAREERQLSVLRWIAQAIPPDSRWHPVFTRYVELVGSRVWTFGGDPREIRPSPFGDGRREDAPAGDERAGTVGRLLGALIAALARLADVVRSFLRRHQ